jgi:2-phospho-L-lactate guanylyltransferase
LPSILPRVERTGARLENSAAMSDWINDRTSPVPASASTAARRETRPTAWSLVVPVKGGEGAKSRLRAPEGVDRIALARALALDTVVAAAQAVRADHVVVVTSDAEVSRGVRELGVHVLRDPGQGLDAAARAGLATVEVGHPAAVLLGDVPAVRAADLRTALVSAKAYDCWFVPDAEGTGTVLLGASDASSMRPRFGAGSAARHEAEGHVRLDLDVARLRRDVDDEASLGEALRLGVGRHTAALLAHVIGL